MRWVCCDGRNVSSGAAVRGAISDLCWRAASVGHVDLLGTHFVDDALALEPDVPEGHACRLGLGLGLGDDDQLAHAVGPDLGALWGLGTGEGCDAPIERPAEVFDVGITGDVETGPGRVDLLGTLHVIARQHVALPREAGPLGVHGQADLVEVVGLEGLDEVLSGGELLAVVDQLEQPEFGRVGAVVPHQRLKADRLEWRACE